MASMSTLGIVKQALVLLSNGRSRISCQNMNARNRHSNHSLRLPNRAFSRWTRLALAAVLVASTRLAFATANYVYHERTGNDPGCGGAPYVAILAPTSAQAGELRF